ncbi:TPA: phage tail spike protein [Streptococcus suis]
MLYLLDKDVKTVKWNGIPLHEASSAIVKEEINGDFTLTVRYPIADTDIYQLIKEDMLIKAPTPVLGPQLFRIKKPVENDDSLDITAYHITDDVMTRSIRPMNIVRQACGVALSQMVQNAKTELGIFSFSSDITDNHTFNTDEDQTLYSVLLDGKHSIVGTWEGELVRDNFALTVKRSRGADRGVIITTHRNLKSYQRTKNSQGVVTRIHARSTFRPEGAEKDTVISVTVDSPLINSYPYVNEKEYQNNDIKSVEELRKWAERKFKYEHVDKPSDEIKIDAYEIDGQVVHLGDTVNIKSRKHGVDIYKKAIAYEYNALTEEYISITFDDKSNVGSSGVSSGVANAADAILGVNLTAQEIALERAIQNANQAFDAEFEKRKRSIEDGIEQAQAEAERYADNIKQEIATEINDLDTAMQAQSEEHDRQVSEILTRTGANTDLANVAKQLAERAQVNLDRTRSSLETLIGQANTKAGQLEQFVGTIRADLTSQARSILAQAQAQTVLTNRVTTVETLADGTRSTVTELSKTVNKATGDIASVTSRTKTVEDTLTQTRTQYEALTQTVNAQTGQIESINRKTADLQSGIDGVRERFESLRIEDNLLLNSSFNENLNQWQGNGVTIVDGKARITGEFNETKLVYQSIKSQTANDDVNQVYIASISVKVTNFVAGSRNPFLTLYVSGRKNDSANTWFGATYLTTHRLETINNQGFVQFTTTFKVNVPRSQIGALDFCVYARDFTGEVEFEKVSLRRGNIDLGWQASPEDLRSEIATYVRNASENSAELSRQIQLADGKAVDAKTYAQQTAAAIHTRLESLETYKDGESTRASQYFTASRDETARQVTALRTAVTNDYVAKSTFEENARGVAQRFESLQVGGTNLLSLSKAVKGFYKFKKGENIPSAPYAYGVPIAVDDKARYVLQAWSKSINDFSWIGAIQLNNEGQAIDNSYLSIYPSKTSLYFKRDISILPNAKYIQFSFSNDVFGDDPNLKIQFEKGSLPTDYKTAPEDQQSYADTKIAEYKNTVDGQFVNLQTQVNGKANLTDFQRVQTTSQLYERIIGSTESGVKDKLARIVMADSLFQTEVKDAISGTATQVSQLAGSYAIKNLTSSGKVLNQLNLNKDGSVKIDGSLVQITGRTYIQDGIISAAKIGDLDAGKITSGYLDAARIRAGAIDGSKIAFDEAFFNGLTANQANLKKLFAKDAFLTAVQAVSISASQITGGLMRATNGALDIDLNNAEITFKNNAKIRFLSSENSISRSVANLPKQFLRFETGSFLRGGVTKPASKLVIGANNQGIEDSESDFFSGQRWWQTKDKASMGELVADQVLIYSNGANRGPLVFNTLGNVKNFHPVTGALWDIGLSSSPFRYMYVYDIYLQNGVRLGQALKDLANRVGHNGWGDNIS